MTMKRIGAAVGAAALLLTVGVGTASAETVTVTTLPGNVKMMPTDSLTLNVANATVCPGAGWTLKAALPGKQDAVTLTGVQCNGTTLVGTITKSSTSHKKNAVVKLTATNTATSETVMMELVVHVKMKPSKKQLGETRDSGELQDM